MTVKLEEPGIWVGYCDTCGERLVLDADEDATKEDAVEELELKHDWLIGEPDIERFASDFSGDKRLKVSYDNHTCRDCQ